ncbi:glycosyl hydrolase family 28 protein [Mucilaginibacter sp. PAMB04168]|uniref:glycoside hydrolase family 28 protein n=1 Tax=Mucilaginibacter sp. PAMB04168 TaxID=3138567 RepID=UPI0031F62BA6
MLKKFTLIISVMLACGWSANAQSFNITDYGAVAGGQTLNTQFIQKAVDAAAAKGGGKVIVPQGIFLTGTIHLKSNVEFFLDKGAILTGSTNLSDYERTDRWYAILIADKQSNIKITGYGTIDGQGKALAKNVIKLVKNGAIIDEFKLNRPDEHLRPQLIEIQNSAHVQIKHVTLKDAACWVQTYNKCTDLLIDSINVQSTAFWNNDGIDVVDCKDVKIKNCNINAADDGICLKSSDRASACQNIEISNCRVRSSASAIKFGTASLGGFKQINVHDIEIYDTYRVAIALEIVDGGTMEDVIVSNINARNTGGAIFIRLGQRKGDIPGILRRVNISNVTVDIPKGKPDAGYDIAGPPEEDIYPHNLLPTEIVGLPGHPVRDVKLENINITYGGGADKKHAFVSLDSLASIPERASEYPEFSMFGELPAWGIYARHAENIQLKNVTIRYKETDFRAAIVMDDVKKLIVDGLNIPTASTDAVIVLRKVSNEVIKKLKTPVAAKKAVVRKL